MIDTDNTNTTTLTGDGQSDSDGSFWLGPSTLFSTEELANHPRKFPVSAFLLRKGFIQQVVDHLKQGEDVVITKYGQPKLVLYPALGEDSDPEDRGPYQEWTDLPISELAVNTKAIHARCLSDPGFNLYSRHHYIGSVEALSVDW